MQIKRRKIFPNDAFNPQENLSKYSRIATVVSVDAASGTCSLKWLDNPGERIDVPITQGSWGEYNMPVIGAVVFVQLDKFDQARIVRYWNANQSSRQKLPDEGGVGELPKLQPGDKFWESAGKAIFYMNSSGKILLLSPFDDLFEIDPDNNLIKSKSINNKIVTDTGTEYSGQIKRFVTGTGYTTITDGVPTDNFPNGTPYQEHTLEIKEKSLDTTPILQIKYGTLVDTNGNIVDKLGNTTSVVINPDKQVVAEIVLRSGVQIDIDKEGRISIKNAKININGGSVDASDDDISLGLEVNNISLGTRGQHIAREHDKVTIPLSSTYNDTEHLTQSSKATNNLSTLQRLASAIMSPAGPCSLNPAALSGNITLEGEITEGSENVYLGD